MWKDDYLRLALASPELSPAKPSVNAARQGRLLQDLDKKGAELIVFPTLSLSGVYLGDALSSPDILASSEAALLDLAGYTRNTEALVISSLPILHQRRIYLCFALLAKGEVLALYPAAQLSERTCLPLNPYSNPDKSSKIPENQELHYLHPGKRQQSNLQIVSKGNAEKNFAVPWLAKAQIFADRLEQHKAFTISLENSRLPWHYQNITRVEAGCLNLVFALNSQDLGLSKRRHILYSALSESHTAGIAIISPVEGESSADGVFAGERLIFEAGLELGNSGLFNSESLWADIDMAYLALESGLKQIDSGQNKEIFNLDFPKKKNSPRKKAVMPLPGEHSLEEKLIRPLNPLPFLPTENAETFYEEALSILSQGLLRRMLAIGEPKLLLGLSGGLDSCLALLICIRALELASQPHSNLICVGMPGPGSHNRSKNNARKLAEEFAAKYVEIPITEALEQHLKDISHKADLLDTTYENAQARERTQILMDMANKYHGIVIGTGDLSETALGWCTYNGDQMSMYNVNASVPKTLSRALVQYEGERFARLQGELADCIFDIIATPVSPELLPGEGEFSQKTEDILGPYDLHDFFLWHMLKKHAGAEKLYHIAEQAFSDRYEKELIKQSLQTFLKRFVNSQFKRSAMPEGANLNLLSLSPRQGWYLPGDLAGDSFLQFLD